MIEDIDAVLKDQDKFKNLAKMAFDLVDIDKSGLIEMNELGRIINQMAKGMNSRPPAEEEIKEVLEGLDVDHNGDLDFEEFSEFIKDILNEMKTIEE